MQSKVDDITQSDTIGYMTTENRKIIKAELGVQFLETSDRVFLILDGYEIFNGGLPKALKGMVEKSYNNLVNIRKKEQNGSK